MKTLFVFNLCLVVLLLGMTGCSHVQYNTARQRENTSAFADNFRGGESISSQTDRKLAAYKKPLWMEKNVQNFSDNFWSSPLEQRLSVNPYDYARPKEVVVLPDRDVFLIEKILEPLPH